MAFDSYLIRGRFLQYFAENGHTILPSSALTDARDPTLFFTNAGMNQFKDCFLGRAKPIDQRVATCQACMRAGGKHSDLENVGHTKRHLTLFEMLGNFSFGDYFKRQAIDFAWEVSTQLFELEAERIYPTVFESDDEAFDLWRAHVPAERITRLGKSDNFWTMGQQGPCGPCSELLYDRGPEFGSAVHPGQDAAGERYLEFWNLVFMQGDLSASGQITPLPQPMIDTGLGLERIVMLKKGVDTVFETDILRQLIERVESLSGRRYQMTNRAASAFRVIADHSRSIYFAITDGIAPSNVDRGYVIRKLIRRAVRYGKWLGLQQPFLAQMLPAVEQLMGQAYPKLVESQERVAQIITSEEISFARALRRGERHFEEICQRAERGDRIISGFETFTLKDTYGLPFEDISQLAQERGLTIDQLGYRELETKAKDLAKRETRKVPKSCEHSQTALWQVNPALQKDTLFSGYTTLELTAEVLAITSNGQSVLNLQSGQRAEVILSATPFYAEKGGQVSDQGELLAPRMHFAVSDCQFIERGLIAHAGQLTKGPLAVGDTVTARVDAARRNDTARNHTAVHLLHWALCQHFGDLIRPTGSLVQRNRLRLDFSLTRGLNSADIAALESAINQVICANEKVMTCVMPYQVAREDVTIKQFFGEKYPDEVRLVQVGGSKELCGGTHCNYSGEIGYFRISKEGGLAAGIRRIEALTGLEAHNWVKKRESYLAALTQLLRAPDENAATRLDQILKRQKALEESQRQQQKKDLLAETEHLIQTATVHTYLESNQDFHLVVQTVQTEDLKALANALVQRLQSALVILTRSKDGRAFALIQVSQELARAGLKATQFWPAFLKADFRGGGSDQIAQGAGPSDLLERALSTLKSQLNNPK